MIKVRYYKEIDAPALASLYYHTIHAINSRDYNEVQINAWAPESSLEAEDWMKKWEKFPPFVAVIADRPVGFAEFNIDKCHIDCFFVHHEHQGEGVGSALMDAVLKNAESAGVKRIWSEVSITARPFFLGKGFKVEKEQTVTLRGVKLKNFVMEKYLTDICNLKISRCDSEREWQAARNYRQKYFFDNVSTDDPYTWTFTHQDHQHFVLYSKTNLIGYVHIQLWPEGSSAMRIIVIDEGKRKKGFGKWFMEAIETRLKDEGVNSLHAESSPSALSFYMALGYTPMPFNDPDGYEGGSDDIAVGKIL